jgi:hypothetical protein
MRNILIALATIAMLLPAASYAADQAARIQTETGWMHTMCNAETVTGVCIALGTDDVYAVVDMYENVTISLVDSVGGSVASCDIYGVTALESTLPVTAEIHGFGGTKINSTAITDSQQKIQFNNINYKYMYIFCTAVDADSFITLQGSVGLTRINR